ncbi:MAG: hypothetical protein ACOCRK_00760 [bacterium]
MVDKKTNIYEELKQKLKNQNNDNLNNISETSIDIVNNVENADEQINKINQLTESLDNIDSNSLEKLKNLKENLKSIKDELKSTINEISNENDINTSNMSKGFDNLKLNIKELKDNLNELQNTKFSDDILKSIDNIIQEMSSADNAATNAIDNINNKISKLQLTIDDTDVADPFKNLEQIRKAEGMVDSVTESLKGMDNIINTLVGNSENIGNEITDIFKGLDEHGVNFAEKFDDVINNTLDNVREKAKIIQSAIGGDNVNFQFPDSNVNVINPQNETRMDLSKSYREYTGYIKELYDANDKLIKDTVKGLLKNPNNNNSSFETKYLLDGIPVINDELQRLPDEIIPSLKDMEDVIKYLIKELKENGSEENKAAINELKNELDELKGKRSQAIETYSEAQNRGLTERLDNIIDDRGSEYDKAKEFEFAKRSFYEYNTQLRASGNHAHSAKNYAKDLRSELNSNYSKYNWREKQQINDTIKLNPIIEQLETIEKLKSVIDEDIDKGVIKSIERGFKDDASEEELQIAINQLKSLMELTKRFNEQTLDLKSLIKIDKKTFETLDRDTQNFIKSIHRLIDDGVDLNEVLEDVVEKVEFSGHKDMITIDDEDKEKLNELNEELRKTSKEIDKATKKSKTLWQSFKNGLNNTMNPLQKFAGAFGMGMLPLTTIGMANFGKGIITEGYNPQRMLLSETMMQEARLGLTPTDSNAEDNRNFINRRGATFHKLSNGRIGLQEYGQSYNNLLQNVGGQYGISNQQEMEDLRGINEDLFAVNKTLGISDPTFARAVQVFYKEHEMGAKETANSIKMLANTAMSANIPIEKYVNTVADLAMQYKNIGLTGDNATVIMDNLLNQGLSLPQAQGMTSSIGNAMSGFGEDSSQMAVFGMLSGQFSNPFSAMRYGIDRFDVNGDPREGWGKQMAGVMDTSLNTYGLLGKGNEDFQYKIVYDRLKSMGFSQHQADIGVDKWFESKEDGKGELFSTWMEQQQPGIEEVDVLKDILEVLSRATGYMPETVKLQEDLKRAQWNFADTHEEGIDYVTGTMREGMGNLIESVNKLSIPLAKLVENFANSTVGRGISNFAINNPVGALGTYFAGKSLLKKDGILRGFLSRGSDDTGNIIGKVGDDILSKGSDDMASGAGTFFSKAGDDILSKGSDDIARGAGTFFSKAGDDILSKGGKLGLVAGGIYLLSQLFNSDSNDANSNQQSNNPVTNSIQNIERDVTNMANGRAPYQVNSQSQSVLGTNISTGEYDFNSGYFDVGEFYQHQNQQQNQLLNQQIEESNELLGQSKVGLNDIVLPTDEDFVIEDTNNLSAGQIAGSAGSAIGINSLLKMAGIGGKVSNAVIPGVAADLVVNAWDPISHHKNGDYVKEDGVRGATGFAVDAGLTTIGGLAGGPIGAILLPLIFDLMGGKEMIQKGISGMSSEDVEYKRELMSNPELFAAFELQKLGFDKDSSNIMVDALERHATKLEELQLNEQEKLAWAMKYIEGIEEGKSDNDAAGDAAEIVQEQINNYQSGDRDEESKEYLINLLMDRLEDLGINNVDSESVEIMLDEKMDNFEQIIDLARKKEEITEQAAEEGFLNRRNFTAYQNYSWDELLEAAENGNEGAIEEVNKSYEYGHRQAWRGIEGDAENIVSRDNSDQIQFKNEIMDLITNAREYSNPFYNTNPEAFNDYLEYWQQESVDEISRLTEGEFEISVDDVNSTDWDKIKHEILNSNPDNQLLKHTIMQLEESVNPINGTPHIDNYLRSDALNVINGAMEGDISGYNNFAEKLGEGNGELLDSLWQIVKQYNPGILEGERWDPERNDHLWGFLDDANPESDQFKNTKDYTYSHIISQAKKDTGYTDNESKLFTFLANDYVNADLNKLLGENSDGSDLISLLASQAGLIERNQTLNKEQILNDEFTKEIDVSTANNTMGSIVYRGEEENMELGIIDEGGFVTYKGEDGINIQKKYRPSDWDGARTFMPINDSNQDNESNDSLSANETMLNSVINGDGSRLQQGQLLYNIDRSTMDMYGDSSAQMNWTQFTDDLERVGGEDFSLGLNNQNLSIAYNEAFRYNANSSEVYDSMSNNENAAQSGRHDEIDITVDISGTEGQLPEELIAAIKQTIETTHSGAKVTVLEHKVEDLQDTMIANNRIIVNNEGN